MSRCSDAKAVKRGELGFNLIELLMSLSMATILFMSIVVLFVKQSEVHVPVRPRPTP